MENSFENLQVSSHPLVSHKLTLARDRDTGSRDFRQLVEELTILIMYEATRDIPQKEVEVDTPVARAKSRIVSEEEQVLVPILRAGLGMVEGALKVMPRARVGHYGVCRDSRTKKPVHYYSMMPPVAGEAGVIILDPMLATGGSAVSAAGFLKEKGCKHIKLVCLVASPEGVKAMEEEHPGVPVYTAALDQGLNEKAYIVPGLGDAGDRLYGTF